MTSSVLVALDTTPPVLDISVPKRVDPPEDIVLKVSSNEDIGIASFALTDSLGTLTNLGYSSANPRSASVSIPTIGLGSGPATLLVSISDKVSNFTRQRVKVQIVRSRGFEVESDISRVYNIDSRIFGVD